MKIAFVINDLHNEKVDYTTTHLAQSAIARGHEVWYIPLSNFSYGPDNHLHAHARRTPRSNYRTARAFLRDMRSEKAVERRINVDELDVLMLRNDPAEDVIKRPWARLAGINFGRMAARQGVIVLNDPDGLYRAINKIYLETFPEKIRPNSLVTRDRREVIAFAKDHGGRAVVKPLTGSGGHGVYLISLKDRANVNQMIDAVLEEGYALTQELIPEASKGDTRLFMMNGLVLEKDGAIAAIRRVRSGGDLRSNITAGGKAHKAEITDAMLDIADAVRPALIKDGMFLVGLDIVGSKLMEINVFSPGAIWGSSRMTGVRFDRVIIDAIERKVEYVRTHERTFINAEIATL